jgi:hypothetical protein
MGRRGRKRQLVVEDEYWGLVLAGDGDRWADRAGRTRFGCCGIGWSMPTPTLGHVERRRITLHDRAAQAHRYFLSKHGHLRSLPPTCPVRDAPRHPSEMRCKTAVLQSGLGAFV